MKNEEHEFANNHFIFHDQLQTGRNYIYHLQEDSRSEQMLHLDFSIQFIFKYCHFSLWCPAFRIQIPKLPRCDLKYYYCEFYFSQRDLIDDALLCMDTQCVVPPRDCSWWNPWPFQHPIQEPSFHVCPRKWSSCCLFLFERIRHSCCMSPHPPQCWSLFCNLQKSSFSFKQDKVVDSRNSHWNIKYLSPFVSTSVLKLILEQQ